MLRKFGTIAFASAVLLAAATQSTFASAGLQPAKAAPVIARQAAPAALLRVHTKRQLALVPLCYYEYAYECVGGRCVWAYEWYCP